MKKVALVFLLAVFVPSILLAWLALRSLRDQKVVIERQQALLYQTTADSLSRSVNDHIVQQERAFEQHVETFLAGGGARNAARFDETLTKEWPLAGVGFVVAQN